MKLQAPFTIVRGGGKEEKEQGRRKRRIKGERGAGKEVSKEGTGGETSRRKWPRLSKKYISQWCHTIKNHLRYWNFWRERASCLDETR